MVAQGVDRPDDDIDSTPMGGKFEAPRVKLAIVLSGDGSSRTTLPLQSSCEESIWRDDGLLLRLEREAGSSLSAFGVVEVGDIGDIGNVSTLAGMIEGMDYGSLVVYCMIAERLAWSTRKKRLKGDDLDYL